MPVDPGPEDVKRYVEEDDGGPVVMLNMLKYKADGGRESYAEYGAKVMDFLNEVEPKFFTPVRHQRRSSPPTAGTGTQ